MNRFVVIADGSARKAARAKKMLSRNKPETPDQHH
jgi:hypothetical protein